MIQQKIELTIQQLYDCYTNSKKLDCNPAYQRDYIAKENKPWQKKLIKSQLQRGRIIPALYMRVDNKEVLSNGEIDPFVNALTEVIDGQQRLRTLVDFINGEFKVDCSILTVTKDGEPELIDLENGYTFKQIKDQYSDIAEQFLNKKITIVGTYSTNEQDIIQLFRDLNDLNDMNNQEKRNCTKAKIGVWVREAARLGTPRKTTKETSGFHSLFTRNEQTQQSEYFNMKFKRMAQDEMLAKMFSISEGYAEKNGWDKNSLDNMYNDSDYGMKINEKKISNLLDKLKIMLEPKGYKKMLNLGTTLNLVLFTNYIIDNKSIKVNSWSKLLDWFMATHQSLLNRRGDDETDYSLKTRLGSDSDAVRTRLNYILHLLPSCDAIQDIDPRRVISDWEAFDVWLAAGKKCEDCDEPITFSEMVKAHKDAHSNGGLTTVENSKSNCSDCNIPIVV